jgi:hypothetical protein
LRLSFNTLREIESLIAEVRSLTAEDICNAGKQIPPITDGTCIIDGDLSPEGIRIFALLTMKSCHLQYVADILEEMYAGSSLSNDTAGTEQFLYELCADTAVLWEMVEYECLRRFPTSEGRNQSYDIGPNFKIFLLPPPPEEPEEPDSDEDSSMADKYFIPTHLIPGPSGLPN